MTDRTQGVDPKSLDEADRQLAMLEDVMLEEAGCVSPWVRAARTAVDHARRELMDDEA
jgi:hypothetical protein